MAPHQWSYLEVGESDMRHLVVRHVEDGRTVVAFRDLWDRIPEDTIESESPDVARFTARELTVLAERERRLSAMSPEERRRARAQAIGELREDVQEPVDVCPYCNGTRWYETDLQGGECPFCGPDMKRYRD